MAAPFPEAQLEPFIYMGIGGLLKLVIVLSLHIKRLHRKIEDTEAYSSREPEKEFRVDNIGLSKKSEDLMNEILEEPELQSDLPQKLEVSKATVSNAVSELKERGLIRRKKKANTYLIEPDREELEKLQR